MRAKAFSPTNYGSFSSACATTTDPLYTGVRTPLRKKGYSWKVQVTLYEKCTADDVRQIRRIHEATASRATFEVGMDDAVRQALAVLRHEEANSMEHLQYRYYARQESGNT